jgi:hypothetical protein
METSDLWVTFMHSVLIMTHAFIILLHCFYLIPQGRYEGDVKQG